MTRMGRPFTPANEQNVSALQSWSHGPGDSPAQSMPTPGMMQSRGELLARGGCSMMQLLAQLEERLRRPEERFGVPNPPG